MPTRPAADSPHSAQPSPPTASKPQPASFDWRSAFFKAVSPGLVTGITFSDWIRLLVEKRFRIEPRYWSKAACTTIASTITSTFHIAESLRYGRQIAETEVPPPLFILGHWRSGTTHLHNLLAIDNRFASPSFSEVTIPHTFLTGEWVLNAFLKVLLPSTRFEIDNVPLSISAPSEEEFALAQLTFYSPYMGWAFPADADQYDRYVSFRQAPENHILAWKEAFRWFVKKLTLRHQRPMILKSPPNTARIRMLLDIFPDARFIHIHRDPYTVYQSTRHLHVSSWKTFAFQTLDEQHLQERILRQYKDLYDAFLDDRSLIPEGRFVELSFTELEQEPLAQIERVYRELALPDFATVKPEVEQYIASLKGYKKNRHVELPEELRKRIAMEWRRTFDEWSYPV